LQRSEGVLLRHLSEVYKVLHQTVPPAAKTEEVEEAEAYLEEVVRGVDSSLLDEWERLRDPEKASSEMAQAPQGSGKSPSEGRSPRRLPPPSRQPEVFVRTIRRQLFEFMKCLGAMRWEEALALVEMTDDQGEPWSPERLKGQLTAYQDARERFRLDPEARNRKHTHVDREDPKLWRVDQVWVDPEDWNDWVMRVQVDVPASDAVGKPVVTLCGIVSL
jgi:hypothetical protein